MFIKEYQPDGNQAIFFISGDRLLQLARVSILNLYTHRGSLRCVVYSKHTSHNNLCSTRNTEMRETLPILIYYKHDMYMFNLILKLRNPELLLLFCIRFISLIYIKRAMQCALATIRK